MKYILLSMVIGPFFLFQTAYAQKSACPTLVLDSVTYTTSPCRIDLEMRDGEGNKTIVVLLNQDKLRGYGFTVYGYGVGLPTYGMISDVSSGGAKGTTTFHFEFRDNVLNAYEKKRRVYEGYFPIHIYYGSERGDNNYINIPFRVVVYPQKKK